MRPLLCLSSPGDASFAIDAVRTAQPRQRRSLPPCAARLTLHSVRLLLCALTRTCASRQHVSSQSAMLSSVCTHTCERIRLSSIDKRSVDSARCDAHVHKPTDCSQPRCPRVSRASAGEMKAMLRQQQKQMIDDDMDP